MRKPINLLYMTAAESIYALYPYIQHAQLLAHNEKIKQDNVIFTYTVSLSYDEISLRVLHVDSDNTKHIHIQVLFEINQGKIYVKDLYHNSGAAFELLTSIKSNPSLHQASFSQNSVPASWLSRDILNSLAIADRIAQKAINQYAGDDYRPAYYSQIECSGTQLILSQINHMNSLSLSHKENYSLRNLTFTIPLNGKADSEMLYNTDRIGIMDINFSDHSSANNRSAGDAVKNQIAEEIRLYQNDVE